MNPKNPVNRRTFLRGLGAAIAVPYLDIMDGSTVFAQAGQPRARASRHCAPAPAASVFGTASTGCPVRTFKESTGPIRELLA